MTTERITGKVIGDRVRISTYFDDGVIIGSGQIMLTLEEFKARGWRFVRGTSGEIVVKDPAK